LPENSLTVGWIGAGRMGVELVLRLLERGYDVAVWNRTRAKAEPLAEHGATIVDRPRDLADRDLVVTMVSSSEVLEAVTIGDDGVLTDDDHVPGVVVDSSTVSVESSERVRAEAEKRGSTLLAAPVSGNPKVVRAGKLSVVVSGPEDAYQRASELLETFGSKVTYVGDGDRARLVKICHNLYLGVVAQTLAETALLAEAGGVSRHDYLDFVNNSVMGSVFSRYKTPAFVNLDFSPTFTSHLLRKDFELGLEAARELDVMLPVSALVHQLVLALSQSELHDQDFAALIEMGARASGMAIESENVAVGTGLEPERDDGKG
jgi:3-hydroxyisobutyrate dehydrogenase